MKLHLKILSVVLTGILVNCSLSYAENLSGKKIFFTDISSDHWVKESVDKVVRLGIVSGYPDGTFRPSASVTRAEFVSMVNSLMGYKEMKEQTSFKDLKAASWYYSAILVAEKAGYISGFSDSTFRPNDKITKEQVCVILSRIMNLQEISQDIVPNDEVSSWAKPYVNAMLSNRIITLDSKGNFSAKSFATRVFVVDSISKFAVDNENIESLSKERDEMSKETNNILNSSKDGDSASGATGGGGNSGSTGNPQMQPVPESPKQEMEEQKMIRLTQEVTQTLKKNMNIYKTKAEEEVVREIVANMERYLADQSYDYQSAAVSLKEKYNNLSEEEKDDLKYKIQIYVRTDYLFELKEKFFKM